MSPPAEATEGRGRLAAPSGLASVSTQLGRYGPIAAGWILPFLLVLYLALEGGGYDTIVRGEVGIALWWVVLLGAAVGVLPAARIGRAGWLAVGLFAAFAVWTGLGISWSESAERSVAELGRVAMLFGVFVLALAVQRQGAAQRTLGAVATAIAAVAVLALLSRLQPNLFPDDQVAAQLLSSSEARLNYPLGYWNGLAHLVAIGIPLMLWAAAAARFTILRALAAAAIPAMALTAFLTLSRGGAAAVAVAVLVLLLLHPQRLRLVSPLLLGSAGGALLIAGSTQRDAFQDGLGNSLALTQGDEMTVMALVVCAGVGLVQAAVATADRHGLGPRIPSPSPRSTGIGAAALAAVAVAVAVAAGVPGELSDRWEEFKAPGGPSGSEVSRFESASGNGRYQLWEGAVDANAADPWIGIGPGTFEYFWAREDTIGLFVRDAHSLYLEVLAELGVIGFALIVGLVGFVLATGVARAMRRRPGRTSMLAAATAGATAFAVAALADWDWELTVLPVSFLLLAAVILGADTDPRAGEGEATKPPSRSLPIRVGLAGIAVVAMVAVAIPLAGSAAIDDSREEVRAAALDRALGDARTAADVQPYAGTPYLQQALVLELGGELDAAARAATRATSEEPSNWRPWLVLSRIEAARGQTKASIGAYREARSLNPSSVLFQQ